MSGLALAKTDGLGAGPMRLAVDEEELLQRARGIGAVIARTDSHELIEGVLLEPLPVWSDDRGYFFEVCRLGHGLVACFDEQTTQVSATLSYPGAIKAFHYHRRQFDCWSVARGMLQVALVDLRVDSPTAGRANTLYVGERRPWQILIPPGVAHGYKVLGIEPAMLIYVTSRIYDPDDEGRIRYDDTRLNYDWSLQCK